MKEIKRNLILQILKKKNTYGISKNRIIKKTKKIKKKKNN